MPSCESSSPVSDPEAGDAHTMLRVYANKDRNLLG